jgi:hypothetical protein
MLGALAAITWNAGYRQIIEVSVRSFYNCMKSVECDVMMNGVEADNNLGKEYNVSTFFRNTE